MANHIRVMVSIVMAQLIVLYLGLQMALPFTKVLTTVGVVAFLEIVYHVVIARKIGANISFRVFWQTFKKVLRKNAAFLILLGVAPIFFKSEDFMAFITWQLFFVVLVSDVIMASNEMFTIQRNHLSDPGVDYVTFGKGDKNLIIITGLSLQRLSDLSNLATYALFYQYAKEYKVYIFDRRDHIEEDITIENMADDLYHSLEKLHITNTSIIGISQGGMIAQLFAIKYPQKVKKLVLALTLSRNNTISRETVGGWIEMAENGEMDQLNKDFMSKSFSSPVLKKLYVINRLFLKSVSTEKRHRFVCLAKSILAFDCYSSLDKITCPTLVLGAKYDLVLGVDGARELANGIPNASYYEFDKLGHAAYIESRRFNKVLLEFLQ